MEGGIRREEKRTLVKWNRFSYLVHKDNLLFGGIDFLICRNDQRIGRFFIFFIALILFALLSLNTETSSKSPQEGNVCFCLHPSIRKMMENLQKKGLPHKEATPRKHDRSNIHSRDFPLRSRIQNCPSFSLSIKMCVIMQATLKGGRIMVPLHIEREMDFIYTF